MNPLKTLSVAAVVLAASQAQAVPLIDHYLGGTDHGYGDVIGSPQLFDTSRAEITREQGRLKIDIFTNFVGNVGVYPTLTLNGKGIGYGVVTTNAEGRITRMNGSAERLTGWRKHAVGR